MTKTTGQSNIELRCYKCGSPGYGGLIENTDHQLQCKDEVNCSEQIADNLELVRNQTAAIRVHEQAEEDEWYSYSRLMEEADDQARAKAEWNANEELEEQARWESQPAGDENE